MTSLVRTSTWISQKPRLDVKYWKLSDGSGPQPDWEIGHCPWDWLARACSDSESARLLPCTAATARRRTAFYQYSEQATDHHLRTRWLRVVQRRPAAAASPSKLAQASDQWAGYWSSSQNLMTESRAKQTRRSCIPQQAIAYSVHTWGKKYVLGTYLGLKVCTRYIQVYVGL